MPGPEASTEGLGGSIGFGERPALLIIDFVNGFFYRSQYPAITEAAQRTRPLLLAAREAGLPIVHTRIAYADDGSDCGFWTVKAPRLRQLTESAESSRFISSLAPEAGERVLKKKLPSAFFGTDLASHLIRRGVDTLIFAGCTTSGCVRATVVDAISHNFRPIVAVDCVGDRSAAAHEANLHDIGQKYADLLTRDAVIAHIARERRAAG
ncbi:isochorismatase family protein [Amaricoccus sp.]|uniref:isochorismatase family protein n=1 Tax=Amaricoccus sp. TaxID=1872485 RepID=UPI001B782815|nr:isochorismatase family protein [Amaricoccus sp.]MBP7000347.1 isochorismatase family protein [Amaricoccus sp.]